MHRAIRTQVDDLQQEYSLRSAVESVGPDMARQEFKDEADVNVLMARFGVTGVLPGQRQPVYSETDFGLDLQQALGAIEMARSAHDKLPRSLREKYPRWQDLLNGLYTGQLRLDLSNEVKPVENPPEGPRGDPIEKAE